MPLSDEAALIVAGVLVACVAAFFALSCGMLYGMCFRERRRAQMARVVCGVCGPCALLVWGLACGVAYGGWQLDILPNLRIDESKRRIAQVGVPATAVIALVIVMYVHSGGVRCSLVQPGVPWPGECGGVVGGAVWRCTAVGLASARPSLTFAAMYTCRNTHPLCPVGPGTRCVG